jgi:patched 1 protein
MITLIEPPGNKRGHMAANRSGQHLLNLAVNDEEDLFDDDFLNTDIPQPLQTSNWFENWLIGYSNSADFSEKWKRDFMGRPTWCDADMSLQQIVRENAKGNKAALYSRSFVQACLFRLGCFVHKYSLFVILCVCSIFAGCCLGLQYVRIETDIVKLWVSEGGRLDNELNFFARVQQSYANRSWTTFDEQHFIREDFDEKLLQIPEDEASSSAYQVLIQTSEESQPNLLTKEGLLRHVQLLEEITQIEVEKLGHNWTLSDICFKPGSLDINNSSFAYAMKPTLERLVPCIWITPIDCFYEGSKPVGPNPPIDLSEIDMGQLLRLAIPDLPDKIDWTNINPEAVIGSLAGTVDMGTMMNFFLRTGIGEGYLNRPCIDPLDDKCPPQAPNYYNSCTAFDRFKDYLSAKNLSLNQVLQKETKKPQQTSVLDIFSSFINSNSAADEKTNECSQYRNSFLNWIRKNQEKAEKILSAQLMPKYPNYGAVMRHGCNGFARTVMNWPSDMILGGVTDNGTLMSAEALQSVILVSTGTDVYKRFKDTDRVQSLTVEEELAAVQNVSSVEWSPLVARTVIAAWQRKFTEYIYNHKLNFKEDEDGGTLESRVVHPLASTSISDMLAEFCDFNYTVIFAGYFLMLLYAIYSQLRRDGCCLLSVNSAMGLAIAGVLTVTFASVAGLGLSTWFGIEFNAATTQIVPFLTLGIGVDNMFLLLHNYPQVTSTTKKNEIGVLMKETGMSILMTSVNNILSFLAGTILPIPALRSFCTQSSILLTFNLISILTIYPAIIAIDLRRKKSGRRDVCCCLTSDEPVEKPTYEAYGFDLGGTLMTPAQDLLNTKPQYHGLISVGKGDDEDEEDDGVQPWTLRAFLRNYYIPFITRPGTKFTVVVICLSLFIGGIIGIRSSSIGLELSDVLPENTAPAAFLKARDKYFSFYPMNIVIKGEHVDFARQQHPIEALRQEIGRSRFVVKLENGEPSERYWLGMFRDWLKGLQEKLDDAERRGILTDFDTNNHTKPPDLKIAYSLVCSYGNNYDCSRVGRVRLIDESGTINAEGFYNYLYGWHEYEQMFYTVSQASFYPKYHKLRQGPPSNKYRFFIPPAPKPMYSQIPFYLTGLKDTPVIVEMIKEIRAISEKYAAQGLDNYPQSIAFTFWEQYLDLNWNLLKAIGVISFAVFCVISLLLFNPWAACCIMVVLLMMTVELAGFLGMCSIKFNPVSAVTLITAVGIGVEFTAHVVFAFLTALGTRDERMASCIDQVFVPVIHGALSTLLGIIMLGFSEFEFVVKYFFVVMSALIIIGLINGLALLPVLLSLVGPACEVCQYSRPSWYPRNISDSSSRWR